MKFVKKLASAALAAGMLFSSVGTNVFAVYDEVVNNIRYVIRDVTEVTENSKLNGTPADYKAGYQSIGYEVPSNNAGTVTKNVGDTGIYYNYKENPITGTDDGCTVAIFGPMGYTNANVSVDNPEVVGDISLSIIGLSAVGTPYNNAGTLQVNYKALKKGTATVTLTYYAIYAYESGYRTCPHRYRTYWTGDNTWHKITEVFTVNVDGPEEPVVPVEPETTYSVTYTDGVPGKTVFADEGSEGHHYGDPTPEYSKGTPTREGYEFTGWSPEWSATVTGDVTYVAQWKEVTAEETFTVVYTDGVIGETVFGDWVIEDLKDGDPMPAFKGEPRDDQGNPIREGYTFNGWAPTVNKVVSANDAKNGVITYTATWTKEQKDTKKNLPSLTKTIVVGDENKQSTDQVKPGDTVKFVLESNVPGSLDAYITEWETDEKGNPVPLGDYSLTFHDNVKSGWVNVSNVKAYYKGNPIDAKYLDSTASDGCDVDVSVKILEMYRDGKITKDDLAKAEKITVEYFATLDEAAGAAAHVNEAHVDYGFGANMGHSTTSSALADVFKFQITKVDESDTPLTAEQLTGIQFRLVDAEGNEVELEMGEDGVFTSPVLKAGTYTLTEVTAPDGYVRNTSSTDYVLDLAHTKDDHVYEIRFANSKAPSTGGAGTVVFTIAGTSLLVASAAVLMISRKRKEQE